MSMKHGRRALGLAAIAAAVGLTLPAAAQERFDGVTVRVATFGGGWDRAVHKYAGVEFEKLGGKVEYVTAPPRDNLAKLIAAKGRAAPFDVVEMADVTWVDTYDGGFLQKIDLTKVPNTKYLLKSQFDEWKVASWVTQEGIVYNAEKFQEAGIPAPTRYTDLLNPKLKGKVVVIDISQAGAAQLIMGAATDAGGNEKNYDMALKMVSDINPLQFWKVGAQAVTLIKAGDAWASTMHAGFAIQLRNAGVPVKFAHPIAGTHKGLLKQGYLGVVKGSPVPRAAEFFINAYISTYTQYNLAKERGVVPVNSEASEQLAAEPLLAEMFLLKKEDVGNMLQVDFQKFDITEATDKWSRVVGNK